MQLTDRAFVPMRVTFYEYLVFADLVLTVFVHRFQLPVDAQGRLGVNQHLML